MKNIRHPAIHMALDKYKCLTSLGNSKDTVIYPTYGRGKDPGPDIRSYMYNPNLVGVSRSLSPIIHRLDIPKRKF